MKKQQIHKMLEHFSIKPKDSVLVHSAFKNLALDGYDADDVLAALVEYQNLGTLILPTMSWRFVNQDHPIFNATSTPCNTGILAEKFRTQYATHRSLHPTHSVAALGNLAEQITATHHLSVTPCDEFSPFRKLVDCNGFIIMLGVGIDCCTMIHSAEEKCAPDIYVQSRADKLQYTCIGKDNIEIKLDLRRHHFLARNYWLIQDLLAQQNKLRIYKLDNSVAIGFRARDIFDLTCEVLKSNAAALIAKPGQRYRMM